MNQIQRDLTYRLDGVRAVCEQNGLESEACQQSIQLWESQHAINVVSSQIFLYSKFILVAVGFFIIGYYFLLQFLKFKAQKND